MTRRAGYTLMEILVATAIGTVIFASALMVFGMSNRSRGVTATARALQTAMLVEETITGDLKRLVITRGGPLKFDATNWSRLSFYTHDPQGPRGSPLGVRAVVYALPEKPGYLKREWDAKEESVGVSPLTSIAFMPFTSPTGPMVRVTMHVGRDKSDPDGPPIVHTFLARVPAPPVTAMLRFELLSDFQRREDKPSGQRFPRLDERR